MDDTANDLERVAKFGKYFLNIKKSRIIQSEFWSVFYCLRTLSISQPREVNFFTSFHILQTNEDKDHCGHFGQVTSFEI